MNCIIKYVVNTESYVQIFGIEMSACIALLCKRLRPTHNYNMCSPHNYNEQIIVQCLHNIHCCK